MADDNSVFTMEMARQEHRANIATYEEVTLTYVFLDLLIQAGISKPTPSYEEMKHRIEVMSNVSGRVCENKTCAVFDWIVQLNFSPEDFHPGIVRIQKEYRLPCGMADRVLWHEDGTITVVEVKGPGSRRDHASGIGQVLVYAEGVREVTRAPDVRTMLCTAGPRDAWIEAACDRAGIRYMPIEDESVFSDYAKVVAETIRRYG